MKRMIEPSDLAKPFEKTFYLHEMNVLSVGSAVRRFDLPRIFIGATNHACRMIMVQRPTTLPGTCLPPSSP